MEKDAGVAHEVERQTHRARGLVAMTPLQA